MKKNASMQEIAAYAAGILDGEGSVSIAKDNNLRKTFSLGNAIYYPHITVTNTNLEVLEWFCELFGGAVIVHTKEGIENRKQSWRWEIRKASVVESFIRVVFPYLIIKRKQATILLNFLNDYENKEQHFIEIRELNIRGTKKEKTNECKSI